MTTAQKGSGQQATERSGRPPKYKPQFAKQAEKLCKLGATDADLADFFDVKTNTIWRWSTKYPDFCSALKDGKSCADDRVQRSLYNRAVGFEYDTVKVMQYEGDHVIIPYREKMPPDVTACIFWLKNRMRKDWRDKVDVEHAAGESFVDLWRYLTTGEKPSENKLATEDNS